MSNLAVNTDRHLQPRDYRSDLPPIWCLGCGNFGVLSALFKAMSACNLDPARTVVVSGIGCSSRLPGFVATYGYHGVHGRALPTATGIKCARPDLNVLGVGGDGDGYSIGGGHLAHAARRNPDITYVIMNNSTYGLTKGQVSPTSMVPLATTGVRLDPKRWRTTPYGATEEPINPMAMAIAMDCSFVARGFSYKPNQLADILVEAMHHRGFALVDVLSPCPTFNQDQNEEFYRSHTFDVPPGHDPTDRLAAFSLALESDRFAIGILYKNPAKPNIVDEQDYLRKRWRHPEGQDDHLSLLDELIHRFA